MTERRHFKQIDPLDKRLSDEAKRLRIHTTPEGHNIVVMDLTDEREAVEVAMDLARQTGRAVTVRDEYLEQTKPRSTRSFGARFMWSAAEPVTLSLRVGTLRSCSAL
jgi:hypothetical protein